jgi:hypothetical protein
MQHVHKAEFLRLVGSLHARTQRVFWSHVQNVLHTKIPHIIFCHIIVSIK